MKKQKSSEGQAAQATEASVTDQADAVTSPSAEGAGPSATDAPQQVSGAAGTNSTEGGDIDAASAEAIISASRDASAEQLGQVADFLKGEQDKFRAAYPHLAKAIDAWQAKNPAPPQAVRIVSSVEGFRRGGMAHSREATDYQVEEFKLPEALDAVFAEPRLMVTFI